MSTERSITDSLNRIRYEKYIKEQKKLKMKRLKEASFDVGGHHYSSAFGKYSMDGKEISRDDYFKAKDGGNVSSKSNDNDTKVAKNKKREYKGLPDNYQDIIDNPEDYGYEEPEMLDNLKKEIDYTRDALGDDFVSVTEDSDEYQDIKDALNKDNENLDSLTIDGAGGYIQHSVSTNNSPKYGKFVCSQVDGYWTYNIPKSTYDKLIKEYDSSNDNTVNTKNNNHSKVSSNPKDLRNNSNSNNEFIRMEVAENSNTPVDVLEKLSKDSDDFVRASTAKNPNTPVDALRKLSKDKTGSVRASVAKNTNTPVDILKELAKDEYFDVKLHVITNPNTPVDILKELAKDKDSIIKYEVARSPRTPTDALKELSKDKDSDVRYWVVKNPKVPTDTLKELSKDKDNQVRKLAIKTLSKR